MRRVRRVTGLSWSDVILPSPIPGKGEVLTAMSNFWLNKLQHVCSVRRP